jgi:hypothetical protein
MIFALIAQRAARRRLQGTLGLDSTQALLMNDGNITPTKSGQTL